MIFPSQRTQHCNTTAAALLLYTGALFIFLPTEHPALHCHDGGLVLTHSGIVHRPHTQRHRLLSSHTAASSIVLTHNGIVLKHSAPGVALPRWQHHTCYGSGILWVSCL